MTIWGKTLARDMSVDECLLFYRYLHKEPLWRLITTIIKARYFKSYPKLISTINGEEIWETIK